MVSNLFLQLIHIELLLSYSVKEILTLVKRDPRFNVKLLNDLYFGDSVIDEETHRFIANNVVSWLYERGENPDEFIERIVKRCSDFEAIPSRCVLRTYLPYISSFYSCKDVRELCLEIIPKRYQFLKQAAVLRNEVVAENREMLFTYKFDTPSALVSNPMRWIIGMFRVGPLLLGTPTYEHMNFLASQTSFIEAMENRLPVEMRDGDVYVNGEVVGKSTLFGECVKKCGIKWEDERELEIGCVLATKDVIDPKTKTVLAKEGCFYGAPANILDVKFKANISCVEPFIKLMNSVVKQEFEAWQPIQKAQEQLLDAMNDSVTIVYYKSDDSISVNSKHLMRNVPARILRNLLREYTATGREEYENREFKRDSAICMDPLRPNFESRLNRVIAHINGTDDKDGKENEGVKKYFEIERHRRGGFRFVPKCKIVFREE
ncbi:hypothetical protein [uncultured Fibrobacter sp.]|uniref:hypothetical protein n=1 Tax=uncultured Fibrobacter sp. TaxID=261512 RepID=UPI002618843E|nr:hypothetical protein [uncultured Fibrobacter sp.]